jgi:hypothetical protein
MAKNFTVDDLKEAFNHLFYEIWMMNRLAAILKGNNNSLPTSTPVSYTHTTETTVLDRSTGIIKGSQNNYEGDILQVTNNALIEAFAIHIRSLLDFFYAKGQDDDVSAEHFFSSAAMWENIKPPKTKEEVKTIKVRVNKEIVHLTYARQDVKSKVWPFIEIQDDLNKAISIFTKTVPNNLLGNRWD